MLKNRIIAKLLIRNDICVQSVGFGRYLPLGKPEVAIAHCNAWGVDEIVCLHIDGSGKGDADYQERIASYASYCQAPLSVGGGIGSVAQVQKTLYFGADKVVVNSLLHEAPDVVYEAAKRFGKQSLVISIDVKKVDGRYSVFTHGGKIPVAASLADVVKLAEDSGAGEILITSIDHEGGRQGYDFDAVELVVKNASVPVLIGGGYGCPDDVRKGFGAGASGTCLGNAVHFSEHSIAVIKSFLHQHGEEIRHDSPLKYDGERQVDQNGRLKRVSENELLRLRFKKSVPVHI